MAARRRDDVAVLALISTPAPSSGLLEAELELTVIPSGQAKMMCSPPPPVITRQVGGNSWSRSSAASEPSPSWRGSISSTISLAVTHAEIGRRLVGKPFPDHGLIDRGGQQPVRRQPAERVLGGGGAVGCTPATAQQAAVDRDRPGQRQHGMAAAGEGERGAEHGVPLFAPGWHLGA